MSTPKVSAPIPGSTRDKIMQQTEAVLPGTVREEKVRKPRVVRGAWGDAASSIGFALALTLRAKGFKWAVRVITLVAWFVVPTPLSGLITLMWLAWGIVGVSAWVRRLSHAKKGVDTCQCQG